MAASPPGRGARRRRRPAQTAPPPAPLAEALARIHRDLCGLGVRHALVGGLAVSVHAEPRTTRDIDLAIESMTDERSEQLLFALQRRGYALTALVEQTRTRRLATARLLAPPGRAGEVVVDLLFAASGVEAEVVARAPSLEVLPDLLLPVARVPELLALKVLARNDRTRPQDADDLRALLAVASARQQAEVDELLGLIQARGFARGRRLGELWKRAQRTLGPKRKRVGFRERALGPRRH